MTDDQAAAAQDTAYTEVEGALLADADDDVTSGPGGLSVRGDLFAVRSPDGDLVVDLPEARARDLVERGAAEAFDDVPVAAKGAWVLVRELDTWVELATEAHQFVGEPSVGRDS